MHDYSKYMKDSRMIQRCANNLLLFLKIATYETKPINFFLCIIRKKKKKNEVFLLKMTTKDEYEKNS